MDLNRVAVFCEVVRAGSFSAAARTLGLPKATVSRRVAALEAELGLRLLHRTTRSLTLTDAGERYYMASKDALVALVEAKRRAEGEQDVPTGTIRISGPAEDFIMSGLASDFLKLHPRVSLETVLTDERLDLIKERIDVAFRGGVLEDSSLVARKLASSAHIVCGAPAYLEDAPPLEVPNDLTRHECVVRGRTLQAASWTLEGPGGRVNVPVRGRLSGDSVMFAMRAAMAGAGLVLLPSGIAAPELASGTLVRVLEEWQTPMGGLYLVYPSRRHQSAAVRTFIDFVIERTSRTDMTASA